MRHVLFFNVGGRGYTAYAGGLKEGLQEQPLWVVTPAVSSSMIKAKRQVHDALNEQRLPVSMAFCHDEGANPIVAYGCLFPRLKDDKGREGLVFLHAIELNDPSELAPTVDVILQRLAPDALKRMNVYIGSMAIAPEQPRELGQRVCERVEKLIRERLATWSTPRVEATDLGVVVHDCLDGGPWAWRVFSYALTGAPPGWSVFDTMEGNVPRTSRTPSARVVALASDMIRRVAHVSTGHVEAFAVDSFKNETTDFQSSIEDGFDDTALGQPASTTPYRGAIETPAPPTSRGFKPWRWLLVGLLAGVGVWSGLAYLRDRNAPLSDPSTAPVEGGVSPGRVLVVDASLDDGPSSVRASMQDVPRDAPDAGSSRDIGPDRIVTTAPRRNQSGQGSSHGRTGGHASRDSGSDRVIPVFLPATETAPQQEHVPPVNPPDEHDTSIQP